MVKLSEELKEFIQKYLSFVATVDSEGEPNVVPKGGIAVLGDDCVVFADLYNHQTRNNLRQNPGIAISVVNPAGYKGYQLKGKAEIIERGNEFEALSKQVEGAAQLGNPEAKYAVKVKVDKVIDIGYGETEDKEIK